MTPKLEAANKQLDARGEYTKQLNDAARALETTMQSLLRLCVVAPTVNVTFGNNVMSCKSSMPRDSICNVIALLVAVVGASIVLSLVVAGNPRPHPS